MIRAFKGVLVTLVSIAGISNHAAAGTINYSATPFSGSETDFSSLPSHSLPYTDSYGTVITSNSFAEIDPNYGGLIFDYPGSSPNESILTFTLSSPASEIGFGYYGDYTTAALESVSFSNGDSYNSPIYIPPYGTPFTGFSDTTPFTSATLTFNMMGSGVITDYVFTPAASTVPEPGSIVFIAGTALALLGSLYRRRKSAALAASVA